MNKRASCCVACGEFQPIGGMRFADGALDRPSQQGMPYRQGAPLCGPGFGCKADEPQRLPSRKVSTKKPKARCFTCNSVLSTDRRYPSLYEEGAAKQSFCDAVCLELRYPGLSEHLPA